MSSKAAEEASRCSACRQKAQPLERSHVSMQVEECKIAQQEQQLVNSHLV